MKGRVRQRLSHGLTVRLALEFLFIKLNAQLCLWTPFGLFLHLEKEKEVSIGLVIVVFKML